MTAAESRRPGARVLFAAPFRIFFLLAAVQAAVAVPLWLGALAHGWELGGRGALDWHVHEMLFGFLTAVIAGFLFTAIPNWTGRLPLAGRGLAALALLWLAGRAAVVAAPEPWMAAVVSAAFPVVVAALVWREVLAGRNWRNLPPCLLATLLAVAAIAFHFPDLGDLAVRLALATVAMLMVLIGGRIVPSFSRNWLARRGSTSLPAPFGLADKLVMALSALALAAWVAVPHEPAAGALLLACGLANGIRLLRWRGWSTAPEPLLLVLHVGYLWLAVALTLMGGAILWPAAVMETQALHALTAGAFGTMTLAVMTRASLGHGGRELTAGPATVTAYLLVGAGALLRVAAPWLPTGYLVTLSLSGILWSAAFAVFALAYGPLLLGRPGARAQ